MHTAAMMRRFGPDPDNWVRPTSADHDVVVVGAGQAGLGIGFALRRAGIGRSTVIDAAAPGQTGSWTTTARMHTLRTPKIWPQPEYGYPELSFRAWYERLHGQAAYDLVENIPRTVWAQYVAWFGSTVDVPVRHHTRLVGVAPAADHLVLRLAVTGADGHAEERVETTRRLVLATGVEGTGGPALPPYFRALPAHLAAHTGDRIDFTQLTGRNVAVLGAGSSALDAAAVALEAGAQQVHVFTRRSELLVQGPSRDIGRNVGAKENFHRRDDADRWRAQVLAARAGRSCTQESLTRAIAFPGFRVHLSAPWRHARVDGGKVRVDAADGSHVFDFVVAGTGYQYDPRARPELAELAPHIALWGDRYKPPAELAHEGLACVPYLGPGYELVGKEPATTSFVGRIHAFSAAAGLSFGIPAGDAQSLATGIPRLVDALSRELFFEDHDDQQPAKPRPADTHRPLYEHAIWSQ